MYKNHDFKKKLINNRFTWLVTGAAGFIGSNLIEFLLAHNQKVIGLDNLETGFLKNIDNAISDAKLIAEKEGNNFNDNNFSFIEGDICDLDICLKASKNVDYILHQAALGSVPRSVKDPIRTNSANIDGFLNVLVSAKENKIKRFIYAASSSTYGDHPKLPKSEENIGNPLSPYAVTKLVNELYASVFSNTYGMQCIGLRYFNVFGKRQNPDGAYAAVIPKWIGSLLKGEDIFINGDGSTSRDFCYISNVIQMNILSALTNNKDSINQVYNVAVGDRTSLNELYSLIIENLSKDLIAPNIKPIYRDFREGDVRHSQADISKAINLLGYQPTHKLEEGLSEAMDWYVKSFSDNA